MKGGGKKKSGSSSGGGGGVQNDGVEVNKNGSISDYKNNNDLYKEEEEKEKEKEGNQEEENEEEEEEEGKEGEEGQEDERPKLDEGYFEIEAIRRKRVRKGQLQYLIKWRGWPETANTWEPLENLQSCSDVIDAFEESLQSGKSSRKRKRKYGGPHTQSKKKQPRSTDAAYNVTDVEISIVDKHLPSSPLHNTSLTELPGPPQFMGSSPEGENNGDVNNDKTSKRVNNNGSANGSKQIELRKEENEYDPKLSELKGTPSANEVNTDKLTVHFQDGKATEGNGSINGLPKVDSVELVLNNRRTGAKRRKSGSVKRFKQDVSSCEAVLDQSLTPSIAVGCSGTVGQLGIGNPDLKWDDSSQMNKSENSRNASDIVKILKPINFSASVSDNVQDVVVTFMAERSDGKEVIVDNKFLKASNPLLLINFYEQHLKYSTP